MSKRVASESRSLREDGGRTKRQSIANGSLTSEEDDSHQSFYDAHSDECVLATATSGGPAGAALLAPPPPASASSRPADLVHAAYADQGSRPYMEDTYSAAKFGADAAAYAVFDGHGGAFVAEYAAAHLLDRVRANIDQLAAAAAPAAAAPAAAPQQKPVQAAAAIRSLWGPGPAPPPLPSRAAADGAVITSSLRAAFEAVDSELGQLPGREAHMCGTTAAVCVVTDDNIYTANCGECCLGGGWCEGRWSGTSGQLWAGTTGRRRAEGVHLTSTS